MPFDRHEVAKLLAECGRRCCICHRFCGVKIETDHIVPSDDGGTDEISNAIPLCFDCHAEAHTYNPNHPRGRKFTADELRFHRDRWLSIYASNRDPVSVPAVGDSYVGPLQALIDEMEFNKAVASIERDSLHRACPFRELQFERAIDAGAIAVLRPELRQALLEAYIAIGATNAVIHAWISTMSGHGSRSGHMSGDVTPRVADCRVRIDLALSRLYEFLGHSPERG